MKRGCNGGKILDKASVEATHGKESFELLDFHRGRYLKNRFHLIRIRMNAVFIKYMSEYLYRRKGKETIGSFEDEVRGMQDIENRWNQ